MFKQTNFSSITNQLVRFHVLISTIFLIFCFVVQIFFNSSQVLSWPNCLLFSFLFLTTLVNPVIAISLLVFILPFTADLSEQIKAISHLELPILDPLSTDGSIGFLSGLLCRDILSKNWNLRLKNLSKKTQILTLILLSFHLLIIVTVYIGISRNLYQGASFSSIKGFFYNLANVRYLSWYSDYLPLKDFFIFTTVITLSIRLLTLVRTPIQLRRCVLYPLFLASVIIFGYALWSKVTGIGFHISGVEGVNSFFPDIHAFGGYGGAAFVGGLYYLTSPEKKVRIGAGAFALLAAVSVAVSGSRFSIVMLIVTLCVYTYFFLNKKQKTWLTFLFPISLTIIVVALLKYWGDRGLVHDIALLPQAKSFQEINLVLSYRPEIFRSDLLMYNHYPILGIGKGIFYRQSSIFEFSHSAFFSTLNHGENAHNYFLQILVEMGIIGLIIFSTIFIYQAIYLKNTYNEIAILLILGIFLGNLYGHNLLIPNILAILFILIGCSNVEVSGDIQNQVSPKLSMIFSKPWRYFLIATAIIFVISAVREVKTSYGAIPFQQSFFCYKPAYYSDKHTSGLFTEKYKITGHTLKVNYTVYHPDTPKHPLIITYKLKQEGQKNDTERTVERTINSPGAYEDTFDIAKFTPSAQLSLQISTSRCLTPIDMGLNMDDRRLGIQLNAVSQVSSP